MTKRTVLIVEDERELLALMVLYAEKAGLEAQGYERAQSAKKAIRGQKPIDILVTDILLKDGHGLELAHYARAHRPELKLAFVTAYDIDQYLALGEELKALGPVIRKGVTLRADLETLFRALAAWSDAA